MKLLFSHRLLLHARSSRWLLLGVLSLLLLPACASMPNKFGDSLPATQSAGSPSAAAPASEAQQASTKVPAPKPQLIKNAEMTIGVSSVETALQAVAALVKQQQGDLLELQEHRPTDGRSPRSAFLELRVPQDKLDATLAELAKLGSVKNQSIKAEDVSNQLVDLQARLKNLRQTEAQLLEILNRSGSVGDVLRVTQELSRTREAIEQLDAQLTHLRNQVAYSTIRLNLAEAIASSTPQSDLGSQMQNTWNGATRSVGELSVGLLKLGIWLLAYSPYLAVIAAIGFFGFNRYRHRRRTRNLE